MKKLKRPDVKPPGPLYAIGPNGIKMWRVKINTDGAPSVNTTVASPTKFHVRTAPVGSAIMCSNEQGPHHIVSDMHGTELAWDTCGGCFRHVLVCECPRGITVPQWIVKLCGTEVTTYKTPIPPPPVTARKLRRISPAPTKAAIPKPRSLRRINTAPAITATPENVDALAAEVSDKMTTRVLRNIRRKK